MANYHYAKVRVAEPIILDGMSLSELTEAFKAFAAVHGLEPFRDVTLELDPYPRPGPELVGYREQNAKEREATRSNSKPLSRVHHDDDDCSHDDYDHAAAYDHYAAAYDHDDYHATAYGYDDDDDDAAGNYDPPAGYYDDASARL